MFIYLDNIDILISMRNIFVRGIDDNVYREVKARAALLGVTLSEVVNMALKEWLKKPVIIKDSNRDVRRIVDRLVDEYLAKGVKGYIVVFNRGERHVVCRSLDEAIDSVRKAYVEEKIYSAVIREIKPRPVKFLEIGGGMLEIRGEV